ncbi:MAG: nuclear transport factor 2 family protein [Pseudomonadota bacterium]
MNRKLDHARRLYIEGIRDGHPVEAITAYTGDRYTQHSTGVADGREGFIAFFTEFLERNPERHIEIPRGWSDGQYVFLHAYQKMGDTQWVTTDFFDTDADDKIIEHWDVITAFTGPGVTGRTQVDGPTETVDHHLTDANKATVRALLADMIAKPDATAAELATYLALDLKQHNPQLADGIDAFITRPLRYEEIVLCVGEGNFVATLCKAAQGDQAMCQADIFRLDGGKIVEHWDNGEPVPAEDVNGGKF